MAVGARGEDGGGMSGSAILVSLKIGRQVYDITEDDKFLDNGACIQIITKRGPFDTWRHTTPILTKKAMREIGAFARVNHPHKYSSGCTVFSLQNIGIDPTSGQGA
jgi:hypothetical protein